MARVRHKGMTYQLPYTKLYRGSEKHGNRRWAPRWEPGKDLREAGWTGFDFKDEHGNWLDMDAVIAAAQKQAAKVEDWRTGATDSGAAVPEAPPVRRGTFGSLFAAYTSSRGYLDLKSKTRRDYAYAMTHLLPLLGADTPIEALTRPLARKLYDKLARDRGIATASHHIRVVGAVLNWGLDIGMARANPLAGMRFARPAPRVRFLEPEEINALVSAADHMGLPSIADVTIAGVTFGQRQGDLLAFPYTVPSLDTYTFKQSKRGRMVQLPKSIMDMCRDRLVEAQDRATDIVGATPTRLFISERTGQPYNRDHFGKMFALVRTEAANSVPSLLGLDHNGEPLRNADGHNIQKAARATFSDTRDTALTRLVLAGCTISETCAIMGHKESSALSVWQHYLATRPELSDSAGEKLAKWKLNEGVTW